MKKLTGSARNKTSKAKLESAQIEREALRLRLLGYTYQQIGDALEMSRPSAYARVQKALQEIQDDYREDAAKLREVMANRLEAMIGAKMQAAQNGNVEAQTQVLRIMDRQAKLLGLDQPTKIEGTQTIVWRDPDHEAL